MYTTIKVSMKTKSLLEKLKMDKRESLESVILDLIEDHLEINPEFLKSLREAEKEVREGKTVPMAKVLEMLKNGDRIH